MTTKKVIYGAWAPLTCTLAGLKSGKTRRSVSFSNLAAGYLDIEIALTCKTVAADRLPAIEVLVAIYGSPDDGTSWETGNNTDANVRLSGSEETIGHLRIYKPAQKEGRIFSVCHGRRFPPREMGVLVTNRTGLDFGAANANTLAWRGIYTTDT